MEPKELVPVGIRVFVRDMTSGIVLREIRSMWESEGFAEPIFDRTNRRGEGVLV